MQLSQQHGFILSDVMGTDPFYEKLQEISWRRKLSSAEERQLREWLAAHPDAQESIELEMDPSRGVGKDAGRAVASNLPRGPACGTGSDIEAGAMNSLEHMAKAAGCEGASHSGGHGRSSPICTITTSRKQQKPSSRNE
jgi:hypothetical protein